jgi:hypothetical protein
MAQARRSNMDYENLSDEAREVVKSMVYHCINQGACMGMDEGFCSFDEPEKKHPFRIELEKFSGFNEGFQPTNDTYLVRKPMHLY